MNIIVETVLHTFQLLKVYFYFFYLDIDVWDDLDNLESDKPVTVTENGIEYSNILYFFKQIRIFSWTSTNQYTY